MFKSLDSSQRLTNFIKRLSARLARQRGLPIVVAVGLTIVSLIVHILSAIFPNSGLLTVLGFAMLHLAIIIGLIGILLIEPLGGG